MQQLYELEKDEVLKEKLEWISDYFSNTDFKNGLRTMEKLINISSDVSSFNVVYGKRLSKNISDKNVAALLCLEGLIKKILTVRGIPLPEKTTLGPLLTKIGFYDSLENPIIKECRLSDPANNAAPNGPFHLEDADASAYEDCPNFFYHYIIVYQARNGLFHNEVIKEQDHDDIIESLLITYIDLCSKKETVEAVEKYYTNQRLNDIDYIELLPAEFRQEDIDKFNLKYEQLSWCNSEDQAEKSGDLWDIFCERYTGGLKLIGAPGMGKTTEMKHLMFRLIDEIKTGNKNFQVVPIYIELIKMQPNESIESYTKEYLSNHDAEGYYELLNSNGRFVYFIDGFNEIYNPDLKRNIALEIDKINESSDNFIFMTERKRRSDTTVSCLTNVNTYTIKSVPNEQRASFVKKQLKGLPNSDELEKKIIDFFDQNHFQSTYYPLQILCVIDFISKGKLVSTQKDFQRELLDTVLARESNEKKFNRFKLSLKLNHLANEFTNASDVRTGNAIVDFWTKEDNTEPLDDAINRFTVCVEMNILCEKSRGFYGFSEEYYYEIFKDGTI